MKKILLLFWNFNIKLFLHSVKPDGRCCWVYKCRESYCRMGKQSLVCQHISYVYQHLHLPLGGQTLIPVEGSSIKEYTMKKINLSLSSRDTLRLVVSKVVNLVYDLAHHESPIAQWLEYPTGIWKVMGSTPTGDSEHSFSECFDLRVPLHYFIWIWSIKTIIQFTVAPRYNIPRNNEDPAKHNSYWSR